MTAPLSPDEGVRAALVDRIAQWLHDECVFPDPFVSRSWPLHDADTGRREGGGIVKLVPKDVVEEYRHIVRRMFLGFPALSTPVPEEGLPRGTASAAEGDVQASEPASMYLIRKGGGYYRPNAQGYTTVVSEAGRFTLEEAIAHSHPNGSDGPRDGISYVPAPARSTEAGDGVASALPSQGEPAAADFFAEDHLVSDLLRERATRARAEGNATALGDALHFEAGAEIIDRVRQALAAERARADSLKAELDEANARLADLAKPEEEREWLPSATIDRLQARADRAAEDERDRLYEVLLTAAATTGAPVSYAAQTIMAEQEGAMLPADRAALRARTILKETPHGER